MPAICTRPQRPSQGRRSLSRPLTPARRAYLLHEEKEEIEEEFGEKLDWRELPGKVESHVALVLEPADPSDRHDWPRQHAWLRDQLERFHAVFRPRVRQLDPAAWVAEPEDSIESERA
jgi:Domain of unknown function (DUF4268)